MTIILKTIKPEEATRKTVTLEMVPEDQESLLYTFMILKSSVMLGKFVSEWGDAGRKLLIDVKYRLSNCPLTYNLILNMVKHPENWTVNSEFTNMRYFFKDKAKQTSFTLYNHSEGINRSFGSDEYYSRNKPSCSKYNPERIKLYYNSSHELFNSNEVVIVAKVLYTYKVMMENLQELQRQQQLIKDTNELKGLY